MTPPTAAGNDRDELKVNKLNKENNMSLSPTTRAKFQLQAKKTVEGWGSAANERYELRFTPVLGGSAENDEFFKTTPTGELTMTIANKQLFNEFVLGGKYYLDLTLAETK